MHNCTMFTTSVLSPSDFFPLSSPSFTFKLSYFVVSWLIINVSLSQCQWMLFYEWVFGCLLLGGGGEGRGCLTSRFTKQALEPLVTTQSGHAPLPPVRCLYNGSGPTAEWAHCCTVTRESSTETGRERYVLGHYTETRRQQRLKSKGRIWLGLDFFCFSELENT